MPKRKAATTILRRVLRPKTAVNYREDDLHVDESMAGRSGPPPRAPAGSGGNPAVPVPADFKPACPTPPFAIVYEHRMPLPTRQPNGNLHFADHPSFTPNLTPAEIMQRGSFGGTYWWPIYSAVTRTQYKAGVHLEFPAEWFKGLTAKQICSATYDPLVNKYGVKCGTDLNAWQSSGWISNIDPFGWYHWYCRFYLGRRSSDDERQIARGLQVFGPTGRWRAALCSKIVAQSKARAFDDETVSPVIRQTLQHWGYELTAADFAAYCKAKRV